MTSAARFDADAVLEARFGVLSLAQRVRTQVSIAARRSMRYMRRRSSASARGKPALLTSSAARSASPPPPRPRGQFVLHAKPLHGNPFDGHTLRPVIADMEKLTGVEARRIYVDKG